jgi:DNA-binding NarL/FixJ family response regulator
MAVRSGLRTLLSAGEATLVIDEAASLAEALPLPKETDVLVLVAEPTALPYLTQTLLDNEPLPVLVLLATEGAQATRTLAALYPRPWGLLPLDAAAEELLAAVEALRQGLFVSSPALIEPLATGLRQLSRHEVGDAANDLAMSMIEALTEREMEILQLLAQGLANKQIAARLSISEHTVKFHVSAIYHKLGASNRTEAVRLGVRQGLIVL